jgi:SAM-dependent methyltransferase
MPKLTIDSECQVCGQTRGHRLHYPRENLLGTWEEFEYLECGYCGCLQITEIPPDLGKYYPSGYYSFSQPRLKSYPDWMMALRHRRSRAFLGQGDPLGRLLARFSKENEHFSWVRRAGGRLDWRVVDVGCGSGKLILQMHRDGFHNICGVDAFIDQEVDYGNGVRIHKRALQDVDGEYDFLMLHHSFEHMPDPLGTLRHLRRLVSPEGCVLIRLPLADSYARRRYGVHWYAWQAPCHLFLHTVKSMHVLAEQAGFRISHVYYDSWRQQFEAESRIRRGLAPGAPGLGEFSEQEISAMRQMVTLLNDLRDGDQAGFFLHPIDG